MKTHFYFVFLLLIQMANSQTGKIISGKVVNNNFPIAKVDVINLNQNKVAVSNNEGNFQITAKMGDVIAVFLKEYYATKITISQTDLDTNWLQINLSKMPIELEEVVVANEKKTNFYFSQEENDKIKLVKEAAAPKVDGVYMGTITNGADFVRMGKDAAKLYKKIFKKNEADKLKNKEKIKFKDYLESNYNDNFYTKTLKLKTEDIYVFKEYCDSDKQSVTLMEDIDYLRVFDFLIIKSEAYKKMRADKN